MNAIDQDDVKGGPTSGALAIVARGRYMLLHCRIEELHPELGASGFATVRFFGASGTPLVRNGKSSLMPDGEIPPLDVVPMDALSVVPA